MRRLSLSRAWEDTRTIVAREGRLLASVALALIVLPQTVMAVVGVPMGPQATLLSTAVYVLVLLIGLSAQIAVNRLAIGPSTTVGMAISRGFTRLLPVFTTFFLLIMALFVVLIVIAMVLGAAGLMPPIGTAQSPPPLIILLMLLLITLSFAVVQLSIPIAAAESGGPFRLFSRSWQLGRGEYWRLLAFAIVMFIGIAVLALAARFIFGSLVIILLGRPSPGTVSALVLGLIAGVVQAAFTVISAVMLARIYVELADRGGSGSGVPISGT